MTLQNREQGQSLYICYDLYFCLWSTWKLTPFCTYGRIYSHMDQYRGQPNRFFSVFSKVVRYLEMPTGNWDEASKELLEFRQEYYSLASKCYFQSYYSFGLSLKYFFFFCFVCFLFGPFVYIWFWICGKSDKSVEICYWKQL